MNFTTQEMIVIELGLVERKHMLMRAGDYFPNKERKLQEVKDLLNKIRSAR